jgi:hypothetical protein
VTLEGRSRGHGIEGGLTMAQSVLYGIWTLTYSRT